MKKIFITLYICAMLSILGIQFGTGKVVNGIFKLFPEFFYTIIEKEIEPDRKLAMGTFYLVIRELEKETQDKWKEVIRRLQPHFGYPLQLLSLSQLKIFEEDRVNAEKGLIVVNKDLSDEDYMYQKIGESDTYLSMGPFPNTRSSKTLVLIIWTIICTILAIPILIWSYLLWRDLQKITRATVSFG